MFDRRAKWCIWRLHTRPNHKVLSTGARIFKLSTGAQAARDLERRPSGQPGTAEYALPTPAGYMWRRTTGGLLEVHRCALGSDASLPVIWRSICGRARIQGLGEQQLLGTRSPPRLPPLGVRALSMARTGTDDLHVRPWLSRAARWKMKLQVGWVGLGLAIKDINGEALQPPDLIGARPPPLPEPPRSSKLQYQVKEDPWWVVVWCFSVPTFDMVNGSASSEFYMQKRHRVNIILLRVKISAANSAANLVYPPTTINAE